MASRTKKSILDALEAVSDDSDAGSSGSGSDDDNDQPAAAAPELPPAKRQKKADGPNKITLEDLQAQGYSAGPSVLYMKPPEEDAQQSWAWSDGKAQKGAEGAEESLQERQGTAAAATTAAEEGARLALRAQEHAAKLRQEALKEREELAKKKGLTFSQKEKKKRDAGMQSRGKSTVEEEKRIARAYGVYSGFD